MNGVCVRWRGWIDLDRLDGVGCLEYDEDKAQMEDSMLRDQIERYNQRLRDFEEKQRAYRGQQERSAEQELEVGNDNRERKSKGQKEKTLGEAFFCIPWKRADTFLGEKCRTSENKRSDSLFIYQFLFAYKQVPLNFSRHPNFGPLSPEQWKFGLDSVRGPCVSACQEDSS
ncbi:hypothetical protein RUM44_003546 [Polyplax serrata]|uniref:Protein big brother n=1 Tax=Polyplax serrata TaxID=468196 RepID=A0ABR1AI73_POLSC